ncbi:MAG: hypothetical protein NVS9B2_13020 [Steroidobacteraceae bacterium]
MTTALLDDRVAMTQFLLPIPNSDRLYEVLSGSTPVSSRAYDDETWTARFVASDGARVKCFTVADITIDQAEMIASICVDLCACDEAEFRMMVEEILAAAPDLPT